MIDQGARTRQRASYAVGCGFLSDKQKANPPKPGKTGPGKNLLRGLLTKREQKPILRVLKPGGSPMLFLTSIRQTRHGPRGVVTPANALQGVNRTMTGLPFLGKGSP